MQQFDSIVCISQTSWKGDFQKAVVQLMTELSARHRVLFVDYLYTAKDLLTGRRDMPVRQILFGDSLTKIDDSLGEDLYVWTPPIVLPINSLATNAHDRALHWNINRILPRLKALPKRLNMHRPLVINAFNPVVGLPMLGSLNECATIYYCFDEITTAGDWMSRHGQRYEDAFLQRVDAVVTTSETLRLAKSVLQPHTYCVKNGVNFDLFNQTRQLAQHTPPEKPIVGYLGCADNRIDIDLMEYCARQLPNIEFQFIGEVSEPLVTQRLKDFPNVTFIPPRQPADLPPLLAKWSVGIIPFVCNKHTYTIYPLKINEYLAAGLAVVATPFSLLDDFDHVIDVAPTPGQFVDALRRAVTDNSTARIKQRVDMAHRNSWTERAREFEAVIEQVAIGADHISKPF